MRHHFREIRQRDNDGLFDVVSGDMIAGPFPTISFALRVASGQPPAPAPPRNSDAPKSGRCAEMHPPEMQRAALQGDPSWISNRQLAENIETKEERQIRSLRSRLAVGYSLAAALAPLIWGMPR
jgi:hypothetical protein